MDERKKRIHKVGEDLFVAPSGSRSLLIYREGMLPIRVELSEIELLVQALRAVQGRSPFRSQRLLTPVSLASDWLSPVDTVCIRGVTAPGSTGLSSASRLSSSSSFVLCPQKGSNMDLSGKTAIVTGAGVRLGRAMALALAERGARLVVHYNRPPVRRKRSSSRLRPGAGRPSSCRPTSASPAWRHPSSNVRSSALGEPTSWSTALPSFERGDWHDTTEDNWDRHFDVNLNRPFS